MKRSKKQRKRLKRFKRSIGRITQTVYINDREIDIIHRGRKKRELLNKFFELLE